MNLFYLALIGHGLSLTSLFISLGIFFHFKWVNQLDLHMLQSRQLGLAQIEMVSLSWCLSLPVGVWAARGSLCTKTSSFHLSWTLSSPSFGWRPWQKTKRWCRETRWVSGNNKSKSVDLENIDLGWLMPWYVCIIWLSTHSYWPLTAKSSGHPITTHIIPFYVFSPDEL